MKTTVGEIEAQSRWEELLDMVHQGAEVIITRTGKPVAKLVPVQENGKRTSKRTRKIFKRVRQHSKKGQASR
ncbi:MAG: type II toxin-antitoxin system prevent-host-death family antitoxin [candidate division KSB1 bacterium]|nr:type II toxin-antitoxin system prevent-host-death family antitoxin [candidate division KSB1 bacterium]